MTDDRGDGYDGDAQSSSDDNLNRHNTPEENRTDRNTPASDRIITEFRKVSIDALEPQK